MFLNRREFLGGAIAVGSVLALPRLALGDDTKRGDGARTLVVLHLNGGNDGLNTVIPWKDARYRALRPSLAIGENQVRKLEGDLGLHPALQGLEALFRRDRLAIVNGVGYPQPNYSHFRATEIWFTAQPEKTPTYGWLGRALDATPSEAPLRAVALQKEQPLSLTAERPSAVTMTDFGRFSVPGGMEAAAALYPQYQDLGAQRAEVGEAGTRALAVAKRIARLKPAGGQFYGTLGDDLRKVLALLQADLGIEVIQLQMGGYDTHSNQAPSQQRLFSELGNNLNQYQAELDKAGLGPRVVTMVMSEFGRRARENLSGGTDHGSACPVFLLGDGLKPGLHGAYPSLEDLDQDNLKFTTDFRSIYAGLLRDALRIDPKPVLGDHTPLELFA